MGRRKSHVTRTVRRIIEQGLGPKLRPMITFIGRREGPHRGQEDEALCGWKALGRSYHRQRRREDSAQRMGSTNRREPVRSEYHTRPAVTVRSPYGNQGREHSGRQRDDSVNRAGTNRAVNSCSIGKTVPTQDGSITEGRP